MSTPGERIKKLRLQRFAENAKTLTPEKLDESRHCLSDRILGLMARRDRALTMLAAVTLADVLPEDAELTRLINTSIDMKVSKIRQHVLFLNILCEEAQRRQEIKKARRNQKQGRMKLDGEPDDR